MSDKTQQAADILTAALRRARTIVGEAEQEALGLLGPWPTVEAMRPELQDMLAQRLAGPTGREPVGFEGWELVALLERTIRSA